MTSSSTSILDENSTSNGKITYQLMLRNDIGSLDGIAKINFADPIGSRIKEDILQSNDSKHGNELIVSSYSKDGKILSKSSQYEVSKVTGSTSTEQEKLERFCGYLKDRSKAGVVNVAKNCVIFILPKTSSSCECLTLRSAGKNVPTTTQSDSSSSTPKVIPTSSSQTTNKSTSTQPNVENSSSIAPKNQQRSFLGDLLNKAKVTQSVKFVPEKPIDLIKKQQIEEVQNFMTSLRQQFEEFSDDPAFTEFRLEPMTKERRHIVHEVADNFPDLLTAGMGEEPERYVVVYRKGHRPADLPEEIDFKHGAMTIGRFQKSGGKSGNSKKNFHTLQELPEELQQTLVGLNTQKRDRRTAQDVIEEIEIKKKRSS